MDIKLTRGSAVIKDFCPLKLGREHDRKLIKASRKDEGGGYAALEETINIDMFLVLGMLTKLTLDKKDIKLTEDALDENLSTPDYATILDACDKMKDPEKYEAKQAKKKALLDA